jgi:hypothetical protein
MTAERWRQIWALVDRIDSAPQEARAGLLDELCGADRDLRAEVEQFLCQDNSATASRFIQGAIAWQAAALAESGPPPSDRFGRYQIVRRVGAGEAMAEAGKLFAAIDAETRRWMSGAYQAGAYHYELAQTLESSGLRREGAENFAEAARLWSPWQSGNQHMQRKVAAGAGRDRCRQ